MKRLNLNETWVLCLKMWKWIAKEVRAGNGKSVNMLKKEWLKKHEFENVADDCFFCDYVTIRKRDCMICPAVKIDKNFYCSDSNHNWFYKPFTFYKTIVALNKIRLAKEKK